MSKPGKPSRWVVRVEPGARATDAAQSVLKHRFDAVEAAMIRAIDDGDRDPDALRKLRVATRRLTEAACAMSPLADPDALRKTIRFAKRLRRVAGSVRDGDLVIAALRRRAEAASESQQVAIRRCIEKTRKRRVLAFGEFERFLDRRGDRLGKRRRALLRSIASSPSTLTYEQLAAPALTAFGEQLGVVAQQEALADPHELRIVLKKLKYALELFIQCAPDPEALLGSHQDLAGAQDLLGAMNDAEELAASIARLNRSKDKQIDGDADPGFAALAASLDEEARRNRGAVLVWWSEQGGRSFVDSVAHRCAEQFVDGAQAANGGAG